MESQLTPTDNSSALPPAQSCDPRDQTQHGGTESTEDTKKSEGRRWTYSIAAIMGYSIFIVAAKLNSQHFILVGSFFFFSPCPLCSLCLCVGWRQRAGMNEEESR